MPIFCIELFMIISSYSIERTTIEPISIVRLSGQLWAAVDRMLEYWNRGESFPVNRYKVSASTAWFDLNNYKYAPAVGHSDILDHLNHVPISVIKQEGLDHSTCFPSIISL